MIKINLRNEIYSKQISKNQNQLVKDKTEFQEEKILICTRSDNRILSIRDKRSKMYFNLGDDIILKIWNDLKLKIQIFRIKRSTQILKPKESE